MASTRATTGRSSLLVACAAAALILAGCADGSTGSSSPVVTMPGPASVSSQNGGDAPSQARPTPSGAPEMTPPPTPESTSVGEPTVLPTTASVTVYYLAEGDGGTSGPEVGCGDSAVAVTSPAISFTDPIAAALGVLLATDSMEIGQSGLRNALWQSDLAVVSVDRAGSTITARLEGTLKLAGECDIPRVEQQLQLTADMAAGAPVAITVNGKPLAEALSLK